MHRFYTHRGETLQFLFILFNAFEIRFVIYVFEMFVTVSVYARVFVLSFHKVEVKLRSNTLVCSRYAKL